MDKEIQEEELPLVPYFVAVLEDKKLIGKVFKIVPELNEKYSHLKRVDKSGKVLIECEESGLSKDLEDKLLDVSTSLRIEVSSIVM